MGKTKTIIFGRVYSFHSVKKDKEYYKIDYLSEDGESSSEFISFPTYQSILSSNVCIGTLCTALYELNDFNRGEITKLMFE